MRIFLYFSIFLFLFTPFYQSGKVVLFAQSAPNGSDLVAKRQVELQKELDETNRDIEYWAEILKGKQTETASISRDIAILNAKIGEAKAKIKAKNIIIQQLGKDIGQKTTIIESLEQKIEREQEALAGLIRQMNGIESYTIAELVLSKKEFSNFFADLDSLHSVKNELNRSFVEIRGAKTEVEEEKDVLSKRQAKETDVRKVIEAEQRQIQKNEAEKKKLLAVTKNQEKVYQTIVSERQKKAAQIRSALFSLRDTAAIPFGAAYGYALETQEITGVRPAFLLAILTQETNLGENVGQCFVTDVTTGSGVGKNTGAFFKNIMKPGRDIEPFINLANRLGFDPKTKPVSCPQRTGYGGAMGPSQFIPSTWAGLEKRIAKAAGTAIPDPWIPRDAFFASAIYLSDLGADNGGYTAEFNAAARYYAGSAWKTRGQTYAANVMGHAQNIQENMIDPLQNM